MGRNPIGIVALTNRQKQARFRKLREHERILRENALREANKEIEQLEQDNNLLERRLKMDDVDDINAHLQSENARLKTERYNLMVENNSLKDKLDLLKKHIIDLQTKLNASEAFASASHTFTYKPTKMTINEREKVIKYMNMLSSDHQVERDKAVKHIEVLRKKYGLYWGDLL